MIKVNINTKACSEEAVPDFLVGLDVESLANLTWTDAALGLRNFAWWPVDVTEVPFNPETHEVSGYAYTAFPNIKRVEAKQVITPLSVEKLAVLEKQKYEAAKVQREKAVEAIKVTLASGRTFDGDETSQGRMARAILAMESRGQQTTKWILADNSAVSVTAAELREALASAGQAQTDLWVIA